MATDIRRTVHVRLIPKDATATEVALEGSEAIAVLYQWENQDFCNGIFSYTDADGNLTYDRIACYCKLIRDPDTEEPWEGRTCNTNLCIGDCPTES